MQKRFLLLMIAVFFSVAAIAQGNNTTADAAYRSTIQGRAWKIVQKLNLTDTVKAIKVRDIISAQYIDLNAIYQERDLKVAIIKKDTTIGKEIKLDKIKANESTAEAAIAKLHNPYLKKLSRLLNQEQVVAVKDGMTYGVLPITYTAYLDMLPQLSELQKKQIMEWLVEAREKAIDAESSEKKHGWFKKYKGRINNYLSAAGIDMKKEGEAWQERIKARSANN